MTQKESPAEVEAILGHISEADLPDSFTLLGRDWRLFPDVFPGSVSGATEVMASAVPYPVGGSFLEVGSGTGVIAVTAALAGCTSVTALDVNPNAVQNTAANAELHGVSEQVRVLHSDMFTALDAAEKFDLIFWNVPWTYVDAPYTLSSGLHTAVFDPGYGGQARYLAGARAHLSEGGRIMLGSADLGDLGLLEKLAGEQGMRVQTVRKIRRIEVNRLMEYHLLEVM